MSNLNCATCKAPMDNRRALVYCKHCRSFVVFGQKAMIPLASSNSGVHKNFDVGQHQYSHLQFHCKGLGSPHEFVLFDRFMEPMTKLVSDRRSLKDFIQSTNDHLVCSYLAYPPGEFCQRCDSVFDEQDVFFGDVRPDCPDKVKLSGPYFFSQKY